MNGANEKLIVATMLRWCWKTFIENKHRKKDSL